MTTIPSSKNASDEVDRFERQLGNTEVSYFLPSRLPSCDPTLNGVNDMYLHLGFTAPADIVSAKRLVLIWAIMRQTHPLLASKVVMHDYEDIRFTFEPCRSIDAALDNANSAFETRNQTKDELIDSYLNGPRTLSAHHLSHLILSSEPQQEQSDSTEQEFHLLIATTHFIGDGASLHKTSNDIFLRLSSFSDADLEKELAQALELTANDTFAFPPPIEARLSFNRGPWNQAASKAAFTKSLQKQIGGQSFSPRNTANGRRTIVPTVTIGTERTKEILRKCSSNGVSVSSAMFAVCNLAWSRVQSSKNRETLPLCVPSLNLRPSVSKIKAPSSSYWFLAIGFFNVILPAYFPTGQNNLTETFWRRSRAAKHPLLHSYTEQMAQLRGNRARSWAKEDDLKEQGKFIPPPTKPQNVLTGLSLLGNLDDIYDHKSYAQGGIRLHTLTTGSRQRRGASLIFVYTFCEKLWLSFGKAGQFWEQFQKAVDDLF
ncbi:hypothetical protein DL96DRAFT_1666279 [Flagelloscypha sp. PMI_526]|nr:hypothetical protein DL96DRAFT_1666279 [Flagelloscypha sp. PMI_526]